MWIRGGEDTYQQNVDNLLFFNPSLREGCKKRQIIDYFVEKCLTPTPPYPPL